MKWVVLLCLYLMCVVKCWAMSQTELEDFSNFLHETSRLDQSVKSEAFCYIILNVCLSYIKILKHNM